MYRAGVEGILGIRRNGGHLVVAPCLPTDWPSFIDTVTIGEARIDIRFDKPEGRTGSITEAQLDGVPIDPDETGIRVALTPVGRICRSSWRLVRRTPPEPSPNGIADPCEEG